MMALYLLKVPNNKKINCDKDVFGTWCSVRIKYSDAITQIEFRKLMLKEFEICLLLNLRGGGARAKGGVVICRPRPPVKKKFQ